MAITKLSVAAVDDFADGCEFGAAGPYVRIPRHRRGRTRSGRHGRSLAGYESAFPRGLKSISLVTERPMATSASAGARARWRRHAAIARCRCGLRPVRVASSGQVVTAIGITRNMPLRPADRFRAAVAAQKRRHAGVEGKRANARFWGS
jgi:hypothetical protein